MPRWLVLVCIAIVVSGCGGGDDGAGKPDGRKELLAQIDTRPRKVEGAQDELRGLLADRGHALQAGDAAALAKTSIGPQRARDRTAAARARGLRLERVGYVADELQTSKRTASGIAVLSYRLPGAARPFRIERRIKARSDGDGWRVVSDQPERERAPWEITDFKTTTSQHLILLAPDGVDPGQLRPGLERAYGEIRRDLPRRDLPRKVVVIAAADDGQAEQLVGRIAGGVLALANVRVRWGLPPGLPVRAVLAQRMVVIVSRWGELTESERQKTLVHEMTHTAMNPDTSGRAPAWLVEGTAMYVANEDLSGAGGGTSLARLSKPNSIFRMTASEQAPAYIASSAAAYAIVERHGTKGLFALYDRFNDGDIGGTAGAATTDRVLRRALGMSLDELEAAAGTG
jgi:hypothetical protein